jgi:hypothetical protein
MSAAMQMLVDDLRAHCEKISFGGGDARAKNILGAANYCRVNASINCSIRAQHF